MNSNVLFEFLLFLKFIDWIRQSLSNSLIFKIHYLDKVIEFIFKIHLGKVIEILDKLF
jgi:hypothetical protein